MLKQPTFTDLQPQEVVTLYLRRHWYIILKNIILFIILSTLPLILRWFLADSFVTWLAEEWGAAVIVLGTSFYYLYIWLFLFFRWTDYYLDVWTVTNKRIINREQIGLFSRVVSELGLDRVQDVTAEVKGFLPTFLHYGNVYIQSAGAQERFNFEEIPHPYEVAKKIIQLSKEAKNNLSSPPTA